MCYQMSGGKHQDSLPRSNGYHPAFGPSSLILKVRQSSFLAGINLGSLCTMMRPFW